MGELEQVMDSREFSRWIAYHTRDAEKRKAKQQAPVIDKPTAADLRRQVAALHVTH